MLAHPAVCDPVLCVAPHPDPAETQHRKTRGLSLAMAILSSCCRVCTKCVLTLGGGANWRQARAKAAVKRRSTKLSPAGPS